VTDANGCVAPFIYELPIPVWCLMENESSSSSSRDYWTLPDGMLPWLIVVCAVVVLFIIAIFATCCAWSCLSERAKAEPKQKLIEQGESKPHASNMANAKVHDYDPDKDKHDKKVTFADPEPEEEEKKSDSEQEHEHPKKLEPVILSQAPVKNKKEEKKEKEKKKHHHKKKDSKKGEEVEMDLIKNDASDEEPKDVSKKDEKEKKHKAETVETQLETV